MTIVFVVLSIIKYISIASVILGFLAALASDNKTPQEDMLASSMLLTLGGLAWIFSAMILSVPSLK